MPEETRPPVAIRVVRPYKTEDDFLAEEGNTVTKTSIVLLGALQRPTGVILRFELTLLNGEPLIRGEGRVTAYKERAFRDQPGLSLRFTRLDPRSKAFVDRAVLQREGVVESAPAVESSPVASAPAPSAPMSLPTPSAASTARPPAGEPVVDNSPTVAPPPRAHELQAEESPTRPAGVSLLPPPEDREQILERLRARARALDAGKADALLAAGHERADLVRKLAQRAGPGQGGGA